MSARCPVCPKADTAGHAAFDKGLVSFGDDGAVLANPRLGETARKVLRLDTAPPITGLREAHRKNLARHRKLNGFDAG